MKPAAAPASKRSLAGGWLILGSFCTLLQASALAASCPAPQRISTGVYLLAAASPIASPQNGGRTGNSVILTGTSGITVIDPGPTLQAGRALLCGIRQVSSLPVVALINTHPHPNQVLANGAFPGAVIYASRTTAETMRQRCDACRERLQKAIGAAAMAGTSAVIPDRPIDQETRVAPGGRALSLLPLGDGHSHGDLAVIDHASATLISGDLGNSTVLPELIDGNTPGWIGALRKLLARQDVRRVIPGYGRPAALASLEKPLRYLQTLQQFAEREVAAGTMQPPATVPEVLRPFGGSAEAHLLNLQHVMREAEERWWSDGSGARSQGATVQ
jgi:glyoxylase-like metal-dependent hydrolase (beta-lactamase superfamily II)